MLECCFRLIVISALALVLIPTSAPAQDVEELPGATRVVRAPEVAVTGLERRGANVVGFTLPGKAAGAELLLHDFAFNGDPVTTDKMHLRQVAPGVVEVTSVAWEVGYWRFSGAGCGQLLRHGRAL